MKKGKRVSERGRESDHQVEGAPERLFNSTGRMRDVFQISLSLSLSLSLSVRVGLSFLSSTHLGVQSSLADSYLATVWWGTKGERERERERERETGHGCLSGPFNTHTQSIVRLLLLNAIKILFASFSFSCLAPSNALAGRGNQMATQSGLFSPHANGWKRKKKERKKSNGNVVFLYTKEERERERETSSRRRVKLWRPFLCWCVSQSMAHLPHSSCCNCYFNANCNFFSPPQVNESEEEKKSLLLLLPLDLNSFVLTSLTTRPVRAIFHWRRESGRKERGKRKSNIQEQGREWMGQEMEGWWHRSSSLIDTWTQAQAKRRGKKK